MAPFVRCSRHGDLLNLSPFSLRGKKGLFISIAFLLFKASINSKKISLLKGKKIMRVRKNWRAIARSSHRRCSVRRAVVFCKKRIPLGDYFCTASVCYESLIQFFPFLEQNVLYITYEVTSSYTSWNNKALSFKR